MNVIKTLLECYQSVLEKQLKNSNINYLTLINQLENTFNDFVQMHHISDEEIFNVLLDLKANEPTSVLNNMYISISENLYDIYNYNSYVKKYYKSLQERDE